LLKQNLHLEATAHGIKGDENKERVDYIIHRLGLTKYANARWSEISSGYKLRFELARALLWRPNLLVLDEPLANLDIKAQQLLLQDLKLLVQTRRYPLSILLTSQQLYELEQVTDQLVFLEQGKPRFVGSTAQLAQHWQEQAFEVAGNFTRAQLYDALKDFGDIRVEDSGQYFTVYCSEQLKQAELMQQISALGDLSYFRDISKSSRRLFG
jgi:ABC-2 type transport system ATP-binding protein